MGFSDSADIAKIRRSSNKVEEERDVRVKLFAVVASNPSKAWAYKSPC